MYGMASEDGNAAVDALVARLRGLPLDELALELPEAIALIASFHPEVNAAHVREALADALLAS